MTLLSVPAHVCLNEAHERSWWFNVCRVRKMGRHADMLTGTLLAPL